MTLEIPSDQKLRVATLNLSNNTSFYNDRVKAAFKEAAIKNVDILLLQEVSFVSGGVIKTVAEEAGYPHSYVSPSHVIRRDRAIPSSTGIFSRHPLNNADEMNLTAFVGATKGTFATVEFNGHHIFLLSVHLLRGAENGFVRLKQATLIEEIAGRVVGDKGKAILGGTLNDIPDGDSVRYLKGRKTSNDIKSAFWIDATEGSELEHVPTTRYDSMLGREAAEASDIAFPHLLPERKVDYLLCRGWVYGSVGMPLNPEFFGISHSKEGLTVSDHFGVLADFWFPPKN